MLTLVYIKYEFSKPCIKVLKYFYWNRPYSIFFLQFVGNQISTAYGLDHSDILFVRKIQNLWSNDHQC